MSWHFLQEQEEASWVENCSDGAQFAPLKSTPTQDRFCLRGKQTARLKNSQYGTTSEHLPARLGPEQWTSSQEDFLVRTFPQPEKARELLEKNQAYGRKCSALLAKYDQDSHLLKTPQLSLFEDSTEYLVILPKSGMMRNGSCWERMTWAHRTSENESGFSPDGITTFHTPNCSGLDGESNGRKALKKKVMMATPTATGNQLAPSMQKHPGCRNWSTPKARDFRNPGGQSENKRHTPDLPTLVGGPLNPEWVEWLMGWPIGWTALDALEMAKFQSWQRQHF